eukprot:1154081-Pelagomonas_calceolata.AAC.19
MRVSDYKSEKVPFPAMPTPPLQLHATSIVRTQATKLVLLISMQNDTNFAWTDASSAESNLGSAGWLNQAPEGSLDISTHLVVQIYDVMLLGRLKSEFLQCFGPVHDCAHAP